VHDLLLIAVLLAVDLDDEAPFQAHEIGYLAPDRMLAAEPSSIEVSDPQRAPEPTLRVAHDLVDEARRRERHSGEGRNPVHMAARV
jgi:hypothetical protein